MNSLELLDVAKALTRLGAKSPGNVYLRRAISSAYYALFHCLARECSDHLAGKRAAATRDDAWRQVYRALDHGYAAQRCRNEDLMRKFSKDIQLFADNFVKMQQARHEADYDPDAALNADDVMFDILLVEKVINDFTSSAAGDRRAFCIHVLLKDRRRA